jgi:hypothetical protein
MRRFTCHEPWGNTSALHSNAEFWNGRRSAMSDGSIGSRQHQSRFGFCKFGKFGIENLREIIKDQIDKTGRSPNV